MTSIQFTASACLRLVCESSVAEILHEAGPKVRPDLFLSSFTFPYGYLGLTRR